MKLNTYQKVAVTTVGATLLLIFIGGLVRAAGAGLGCPDWPKCFGSWIPPTSAADLPAYFDSSQFNLFKTWTEYLNRLAGVVIGFLITFTFILSFRYREQNPPVFYSSLAAFLMVIIQGWLGGRVVLTGLDEALVTLHMFLAMAIVAVLLFAVFQASSVDFEVKIETPFGRYLFWAGAVLLLVTLVQMVLGTQVREAVDMVKEGVNPPPRELWLQNAGTIDEVHRTFSWLVLVLGGAVTYLSYRKTDSGLVKKLGVSISVLILFQIALGAGLYYLGMPPAYQVFHLFGFALLFSAEFLLLLVVYDGQFGFVVEKFRKVKRQT